MNVVRPSALAQQLQAYRVPKTAQKISLWLDANEGQFEYPRQLQAAIATSINRYPNRSYLTSLLAEKFGVSEESVLVTAGGDDALERACKALLSPGDEFILPTPTFEMLARYGKATGATVVSVPWLTAEFPIEEVLSRVTPRTRAIALVSPNNPTGFVLTAEQLIRLSETLPGVALILDLAYCEFAEDDLTALAITLPNTLVVRTFSKAWSLAGLRVGYALGSPEFISWVNAMGNPYPCSSYSLVAAATCLLQYSEAITGYTELVKKERVSLEALLESYGLCNTKSQGNFAFATCNNRSMAEFIWSGLATCGIAVRIFKADSELANCLRITCPGDTNKFARLVECLETLLNPQAILFDMDGVMVDVSQSYRQTIIETAAFFGLEVSQADIAALKAQGNCNNDWRLTKMLLDRAGIKVSYDKIVETFEQIYQGTSQNPGLKQNETLLLPATLYEKLSKRYQLGIVTGRPRKDAEYILQSHQLAEYFSTVICMEDAPAKPDPAPVRLAIKNLGARSGWLFGDTPDDVVAAKAAGVLPVGVVTANQATSDETARVLSDAGAAGIVSAGIATHDRIFLQLLA